MVIASCARLLPWLAPPAGAPPLGQVETATLLNDAAGVLRQLDRTEEALVLYRRALGAYALVGGSNELAASATVHNNIGAVLLWLGQRDEARHHFMLAHATRARHFGTDHPFTLQCADNIAAVDCGDAPEPSAPRQQRSSVMRFSPTRRMRQNAAAAQAANTAAQ